MMYPSGRGTKQGQEVTLAVHLRRETLDGILGEAVYSAVVPETRGRPRDTTPKWHHGG